MARLGTRQAGSDFALVHTMLDDDGAAVDLSAGGTATVTGFLELNGAIYVDAASVTVTTASSGIVTWSLTDTVSAVLPPGGYRVHFKAVRVSDSAVFRNTDTLKIVRGTDV